MTSYHWVGAALVPDKEVFEMFDQDSNKDRLAANSQQHNLNQPPLNSAILDTLAEAIAHLDRVLNGCGSHREQSAADQKAREFLERIS